MNSDDVKGTIQVHDWDVIYAIGIFKHFSRTLNVITV
jgi:hypothetical protein